MAEDFVSKKVFQSVKSWKKFWDLQKYQCMAMEISKTIWCGDRSEGCAKKPKTKNQNQNQWCICHRFDFHSASKKIMPAKNHFPYLMEAKVHGGKRIDNRRSKNHKARSIDG